MPPLTACSSFPDLGFSLIYSNPYPSPPCHCIYLLAENHIWK